MTTNLTQQLTGVELEEYIATRFKVQTAKQPNNTETLSDLSILVSERFETDSVKEIKTIIDELDDYGIEDEEQFNDSFSGVFSNESEFCEELMSDCYSEQIESLPSWLQNAIDWEMVWFQSLRYDYFTVYFNNQYYFFNRNF